MKNISENITAIRKKHNMSQNSFGKMLGVSGRAVSKWEQGISKPSSENILKLMNVFGVQSDFFNGTAEAVRKSCGMETLAELYKIGRGPSSSHTIGPERACMIFREENRQATDFRAVLYGSLAKTGKGHGTDTVIQKTFAPYKCDVEFNFTDTRQKHPNTMELYAYKDNDKIGYAKVYSVGGGSIQFENGKIETDTAYQLSTFKEIAEYCAGKNIRFWNYAEENEKCGFRAYMHDIWDAMKQSVQNGLKADGKLPGELNVERKAKILYNMSHIDESAQTRENRIVCAYAYAVSEQNASGEKIVTAPTCGSAGVLPAVLYYEQMRRGFNDEQIINALETAGIVGNIIKTNASVSGAECGCQAEIGSACAMASAALGELFGLGIDKIEYAAEIAIEHHLGLTCDPIGGYVQIPCIERNAVAAMRALNAVSLANFLSDTRKISFDSVVEAMKNTGKDMCRRYKETSEGGLAEIEL